MFKRFFVTFFNAAGVVVDVFTVDAIDFDCALDLVCDIQTLKTNVVKADVVNAVGLMARVIFDKL